MSGHYQVLPNSLLVLVHLHLLGYPLQDASAYNEHLFDPTRNGMRERTKAMEDICYFLIGKIGGGKDHARSVCMRKRRFGDQIVTCMLS